MAGSETIGDRKTSAFFAGLPRANRGKVEDAIERSEGGFNFRFETAFRLEPAAQPAARQRSPPPQPAAPKNRH